MTYEVEKFKEMEIWRCILNYHNQINSKPNKNSSLQKIHSKDFNHHAFISTATRDASLCVIANPAFVVYSSIVSFYVPFIITLLVYVQIYVVLRKRRKRVNTKPKRRVCQPADTDIATSLRVSSFKIMVSVYSPAALCIQYEWFNSVTVGLFIFMGYFSAKQTCGYVRSPGSATQYFFSPIISDTFTTLIF